MVRENIEYIEGISFVIAEDSRCSVLCLRHVPIELCRDASTEQIYRIEKGVQQIVSENTR
jgi:hypothetical protein